MAAAGCLGYGVEAVGQVDFSRLGAIVTRGTTLQPRSGGPAPRMVETSGGLLHAIGHQNPGIRVVLERYAPRWATWEVPVILNLVASSADEFAELAGRTEGIPGVAALELDLGSVGTGRKGRPLSYDAAAVSAITAAVREVTDLPVLVKLSILAPDLRGAARAAADAGADALTCGSGPPALLAGRHAMLSGPAIGPLALRAVAEMARHARLPIVGCGGVVALRDVKAMLEAGATAVAIGTAMLADPALPGRLATKLVMEPPQPVGSKGVAKRDP
ncbi:MAG: tRNA-dihydrouridine synthase [Chloroflexi bacterium]|nr:tRNA-dihydrouridine synthase [Chloroflexota bacterium]